jgi:hypothetical protein
VTCKDLKDITPTLLILLGGVLIMIFVIPYAFSSVLAQLSNVSRMESINEMKKELARNASLAAIERANALANLTNSSPDDSEDIPDPSRLYSSEPLSPYSEDLNT